MDSQDCPTDVKLHSCLKDEDDDVGLLVHFVKGLHAEIMDSVKKEWVIVLLRGSQRLAEDFEKTLDQKEKLQVN